MPEAHAPYRLMKHVLVPMPDGTRLSAHVMVPEQGGPKFPAILEYVPYHKGIYNTPWHRHQSYLDHGYAFVHVDIRGTGDSEGFTNTFADPQQIHDGVEVVNWIARQAWSDGNVGMAGISYVGFVCYQVAMHNPRPLKAIIVYQCMTDHYTSYICPGGSPRPFPFEQTAALMTGYNAAPPNPESWGAKWAELWKYRLENTKPWGLAFVENLLDGPYWRERSLPPDFDRVKCATFFIGGWADWYPDDFLRAFAQLKCPKKVLIGPWAHNYADDALPLPRADDQRECLRWFDQFLKGKKTGIADEPPVTLFVQEFSKPDMIRLEESGTFRCENQWPPERARMTPYYLGAGGKLSAAAPAEASSDRVEFDPAVGVAAGRYAIGQIPPIWGMPLDQRLDEPHSLVYTTEPLSQDIEVTGHPRVVVHFESTAPVAYVSAKLCDVAPDGVSALVSKAGLNATHRESHTHPTPLTPGKTYELAFDLQAVAYRFKAAHRIRLMIANADFQGAWPTPYHAANTIHRSADRPSRVILPIVPAQSPPLPPPNLVLLEGPPPARESIYTPEYSITRDLVKNTTAIRYRNNAGTGVNESEFTVSSASPAHAVIKSSYYFNTTRPGMAVNIEAHTVTASDEKSFHHTVQLQVNVNQKPFFQNSWTTSVPRPLC